MNQKIIKYSVIIPTLNEAEVIQKVLTDLELQRSNLTYDIEIIISDGGSKDGTIEICKNFNLIILNSEKGRGTQLSFQEQRLLMAEFWYFSMLMLRFQTIFSPF